MSKNYYSVQQKSLAYSIGDSTQIETSKRNYYNRISANKVHKGSGKICLVGRVRAYHVNKKLLTLQINQQSGESKHIDCVISRPGSADERGSNQGIIGNSANNDKLLKSGVIVEVRGFGIDNKKMTVTQFNVFEGDINLDTYYSTIQYIEQNYNELFSAGQSK